MSKYRSGSFLTTVSMLNLMLMIMMTHDKHGVDAMALHKRPTMNKSTSDTIHSDNDYGILGEISEISRRNLFSTCFHSATATTAATFILSTSANAIAIPEQKTYSSNARNMDRLSSGDSSGGSTYNNSPDSPVAAKRRAMIGCKVSSSRVEASRLENGSEKGKVINEKDCNMRVMGGDSEFMLKALRNLDCPTCPYGIDGA